MSNAFNGSDGLSQTTVSKSPVRSMWEVRITDIFVDRQTLPHSVPFRGKGKV